MKPSWRVGLDLDGTLIDTRIRHEVALRRAAEAVHIELPPAFPASYYEQKLSGSSGKDVLLQNEITKAEEIAAAWVRIVEEESLLALDVPFPRVLDKMKELIEEEIEFFVCTARQHCDRVVRQIQHLGLRSLVADVLVAQIGANCSPGANKAQLTHRLGLRAVVGDTEADQEWASKLGARFLAVDCGLRSRDFWRARKVTPYESTASALEAILCILKADAPRQSGA